MPRAFTESESIAIRDRLMDSAVDSFTRRGIRGTTIDGLARSAGISKGAFYGFFDSKESLFLVLIEQFETRMHADVLAAVRSDPRRGVEVMIEASLRATERNPLVGVAMSDEGLMLMRCMSARQQREFLERDERLVDRAVAVLAETGVELRVPPSLLVGLMRSLVFVGWHRAEIGEGLWEELADWITPTIRAALIAPPVREIR